MPSLRRVFPQSWSDAARAAALMEREELLDEEMQSLGPASYRRRCEVEAELAEIRRSLARLVGLLKSNSRN